VSFLEEKFIFRFDEKEIVSWQGVSSFSIPAFQVKSERGRLENRKSWLMPHNSGLYLFLNGSLYFI
jgi:hypothetical protein